jgi:hypothetical protein
LVQSRVALLVLETLRSQDFPTEVLEDEDVSVTLPRRLGLSDVIDAQIRRYQADARLRRRIPEQELIDLLRLVVRRPDSEEVFLAVGRALFPRASRGIRRLYPRKMAIGLARRRAQGELKRRFGRKILRPGGKGFVLEHAHDLFLQGDPGGDACAVVTGLLERIVETYAGPQAGKVHHSSCLARRGDRCRWELEAAGRAELTAPPGPAPPVPGG